MSSATLARAAAGCAVLLAALAAAGCAVDAARERAAYRAELDLPAAAPLGTTLTLVQALRLANARNENLDIRGEAYLRTVLERRRQVASFLPTVHLASSYVRRDAAELAGGAGGGSNTSEDETFALTGQLRWNLFNGFRDWNAYWRKTFEIEQRRGELRQFQADLLLDVAEVFVAAQRAGASAGVLENSLAVQRARLADTQARQEVGFARLLDVTQTEAQAAATETTLINARRDVANARELLALLMGVPLEATALEGVHPAPPEVPGAAEWLARAAAARADLAASQAAAAAAERDVKIAVGQYYPTVTLALDAFLLSEPIPAERDWQATLTGLLPVFDHVRIRAEVRQAWSFLREARLVRAYLLRQVAQQVRTAHADLLASQARLAQLGVQQRAAAAAFEQAEASYRVGLATNLDRITAQDALLTAELQRASETFDARLFHLRLLHAAGQLQAYAAAGAELAGGGAGPTPASSTPASSTPGPSTPGPITP